MMSTLLHFSKKMTFDNMIINYPGTEAFKLFTKSGFQCNRYLLGYHHSRCKAKFSEIFRIYVKLSTVDQDIFFCHPGYEEKYRVDCMRFLLSDEFNEICSEGTFSLNRFSDIC